MVNNLASDISSSNPVEGEDHMIKTDGTSAATCAPGDAMVQTAAGTWTKAVNTTVAHCLKKPAIVGYRERILATGAQSTIDALYQIGEIFPLILGFKMGKGRVIAKITDPVATVYPNHEFRLGAVAGDLAVAAADSQGVAYVQADLNAALNLLQATPMENVETIVSGDDYALMEMN